MPETGLVSIPVSGPRIVSFVTLPNVSSTFTHVSSCSPTPSDPSTMTMDAMPLRMNYLVSRVAAYSVTSTASAPAS